MLKCEISAALTEEVVWEEEDEAAAGVGDGRDGDTAMGPGWAAWGESENRRTDKVRREGILRGAKDGMFVEGRV